MKQTLKSAPALLQSSAARWDAPFCPISPKNHLGQRSTLNKGFARVCHLGREEAKPAGKQNRAQHGTPKIPKRGEVPGAGSWLSQELGPRSGRRKCKYTGTSPGAQEISPENPSAGMLDWVVLAGRPETSPFFGLGGPAVSPLLRASFPGNTLSSSSSTSPSICPSHIAFPASPPVAFRTRVAMPAQRHASFTK